MIARTNVVDDGFRARVLRNQLTVLQQQRPRERMREWARRWRSQRDQGADGEVLRASLDMAAGWRSVSM